MTGLSRANVQAILHELARWEVVTRGVANKAGEPYGLSSNRVLMIGMAAGLPVTADREAKATLRAEAIHVSEEQVEKVYGGFGTEAEARREVEQEEQEQIARERAEEARASADRVLKRAGTIAVSLIVLLALALIWRAMTREPATSDGSTSSIYELCEAELKPALEQCLATKPESLWGQCREAYLSDLESCTS